MTPRIGDQVGLELCEVDIESTIKSQRGRNGGDDLADQPVQICVSRSFHVEVAPADVVDRLVVHHEGTVTVLQRGVGGQDGVVRLHNGGCHLWSRVD